jgi:hypothetical protein
VAAQHGVNLGYLGQWVEEFDRAKGAPHSVLFGWLEFGKPWTGWTSPVARLFAGYESATREKLAARYQEVFNDPVNVEMKEFLTAKAGVYKEPPDARQHFDADTQTVLAKLEEERKVLETATPDLPHAMGVTEGSKVDDLEINIRGSHWTLGKKIPRGFLARSAAPARSSRTRAGGCNWRIG